MKQTIIKKFAVTGVLSLLGVAVTTAVAADLPAAVKQQVEITVKYSGYIDRQKDEVVRFRQMEDKQIPDWLKYENISGLRNESRQKLADHRPATLGQASRISGISPSDVSLIMVQMKRGPKSAVEYGEAEKGPHNTCCGDL